MTKTIIAIVGPSASGKTLFAQTIFAELSEQLPPSELAIIEEDAYYRDQTHLSASERESTNYDHPAALEHELLSQHLTKLRQGEAIDVPIYDYSAHNRSDQTRRVESPTVLIIEGILLFSNPELMRQFDVKLFIDTPLDICLLRRMQRDISDRGRSLKSVTDQYQNTVRPMYYRYIYPGKVLADMTVRGGGKNRIAIDMVKYKIQALARQV